MMSILVVTVCVVFWDALYMPAWFGDGIDVVATEDVILASLLTVSLLLEPACFPLPTLLGARRLWLELSVIIPYFWTFRSEAPCVVDQFYLVMLCPSDLV
ncbi:hypothetical protein CABS01_09454 [Colletotrichum abscissum]|uniref:uncharacterized protein n=1 Tax=Colletotrichum abscissum TaxID=1671311 RepID=UPI0027D6B6E5|nr:uncharacterized protein CABS01_09454 [Colletotrichum abscissum]KAK1501723.1 hypothetical protein CABS01_09454 [Colletotrichum abscissum]